MIEKEIIFDQASRVKLKSGIDILAEQYRLHWVLQGVQLSSKTTSVTRM